MQAWEKFLLEQEKELSEETVNKWLRTLNILRFDACNLYLEAKDDFQLLWFEEHMRHKAREKLVNNNGNPVKIHLSTANSSNPPSPQKGKKTTGKILVESTNVPLVFDQLNPHYRFGNFLGTDNNQLALKILLEQTNIPYNPTPSSKAELIFVNPLYLYGPAGTGKTHLLMGAAAALKAQHLNALYVRAETFTEHVVKAIRKGEMSLFRQTYRNVDALLLDDVHIFSRKGATQEEFFHTFNALHLAGKRIILSASCLPHDLKLIEPRLISRFEWGLVLALSSLTKEQSYLMLQNKADALSFPLHKSILEFLIASFTGAKSLNLALEALILRSHMHAPTSSSIALTIPVVKQYLSDLLLQEEKKALTIEKVIQTVANFYGILAEDIRNKGKTRDCLLPRQIALYLCRQLLHIPYIHLGDHFLRDHSTVISSVKQIEKKLEQKDKQVTNAVTILLKKFRN